MARRTMVMIVAVAAAALVPAHAQSQGVKVKGIDSLQVRANVQVQLNTTSVEDEPGSEWVLRRARVGVRGWAAGWIRGDLEADFGRGGAKLTDGYLTLGFAPALALRLGQFKKPFDALELVSSRELLVAERDGSPRGAGGPTPNGLVDGLGYSNRDIGAEWGGRSGRLGWAAGFWNGAGDNESEDDDGKQLAGRLSIAAVPGWTVSGAWTGKRVSAPPDAEDSAWYHAVEAAVTGGEYGEPGWRALGQVMAGDNWHPEQGGGGEVSFLALQGVVGYHVPLFTVPYLVGVEPVLRIGWTDPDTDGDEDEATLSTVGVNLYLHRQLKTQIQADFLSPAEGEGEVGLRVHTVLEF